MTWWNSLDFLKQLLAALTMLTAIMAVAAAAVSNRVEHLRTIEDRRVQQELEETRHQQQPRTFSTEQRQRVLDALRAAAPKGPVEVVSVVDGEAHGFALMLLEILREAGWRASGVSQGIYDIRIVGVEIVVNNPPPAHAGALQQALRSAGLEVGGRPASGSPTVTLLVGYKQ